MHPYYVIENKNPLSGEKFKQAAEICIYNKEPNVNHQDNGENVSKACQRPSQQPFPSQFQRPKAEKVVFWIRPRCPCFVQPQDMVPYIPAALAPAMAKRGQSTAWVIASEGASPKPWQLPCGVGVVPQVHRRKEQDLRAPT